MKSTGWITVEWCQSSTQTSVTDIYYIYTYENVTSSYFDITHLHLQLGLQLHLLWVMARKKCERKCPQISSKKLPEKLLNSHPAVVFTGLRPSRKPRWAPLLPRRPLRLPLSRQGPQSRRRRSWAPMMRSRRTPQTTAKVRRTHKQDRPTHTEVICPKPLILLSTSVWSVSSLFLFVFALLPLSLLPPSWWDLQLYHLTHQWDMLSSCDTSVSRLFDCCQKAAAV